MTNETKVEQLSCVLCAFRWDTTISAERFVMALDRLIEAVREEERKND